MKTTVSTAVGIFVVGFVGALILAVFAGAIQGFIGMLIWNNISPAVYHVSFWQAWGFFIIARMVFGTATNSSGQKS